MSFGFGSYGLGFVAGILTVLSPCVVPILPIILGSAVAAHRFGALMLALGLALSFVILGLFVATIGFAIGLDGAVFQLIGAGLLIIIGLLLMSEALQNRLAALVVPVGDGTQGILQRFSPAGLRGQFILGLLLGAVWSPCVGPTLGAAAALAAQRQNLLEVALLMTIFGIGAALPLLLIGTLSRTVLLRWRGRLMQAGKTGKRVLGLVLTLFGIFILSGLDRRVETLLVDWSPAWLTDLTTRF